VIPLKTIETDRLILRGWEANDYLDLHEFLSDDRVAESRGCTVVKDIEESKNIIKTYILYNQCYAIALKSENKVIGSIGMDDIAPDKELINLKQRYIGYAINPKYWGNGYAPEAVKFLIKYLFEALQLDLIWSSHYDFNLKSKRVIEKCGFQYKFNRDKTIRALENRNVKEVFYNLSKNEYCE